MKEILLDPGIFALTPIFMITLNQVLAVLKRDNHSCLFPDDHDCGGKMRVHHINGKADDPYNIATVCKTAEWSYLHNGASDKQKAIWAEELKQIVAAKTDEAVQNGWTFPED